ncbi:MAG TPA: DUF4331 domain-containing protein [Fibrobacteria bacterium]|nr:DUF4331 domain-containing protein [Fibrobacteria bacterium]
MKILSFTGTAMPGTLAVLAAACLSALAPAARASSHMDAPLITLDDAANTTDVYAFLSERQGRKYLTTALSVFPFEEPGIGPNGFRFDDNVRYEIHVSTGNDVARGRSSYTYRFDFQTKYRNAKTILQSYLGVIRAPGDEAQNLSQTYTVTAIDERKGKTVSLGKGLVPPNNQGIATPLYNQDGDGEKPARDGVADAADLDPYTAASIQDLKGGYRSFAGQRDDGFYGDIQAIFDLLALRKPGKDAQKGFNVHTIVLEIPLDQIGGDMQIAGVHATTSRLRPPVLGDARSAADFLCNRGKYYVQVGRQGNPLFCEGFVAIEDKDLYNRLSPAADASTFKKYALKPELAALLNALVFGGKGPAPETGRTDLAGIFIPDLIKVDLSTAPARLAGGSAAAPNDAGFSRLGIFGGDVLTSKVQPGFDGKGLVPGGWPNGRRFGDDVVDIGVTALISDLRVSPPVINGPAGDNVDGNDIGYNKVFPYAATPQNGRVHEHH